MIKYVKLQYPCFNPYDQATVEIYISGCYRKCEGCFNAELHIFNQGKDVSELFIELYKISNLFDSIAILGGDLLCQPILESIDFVSELHHDFVDKDLWLFTGEEYNKLPSWVFNYFDYIKCGKFDATKSTGSFPSSSNQILLKKGVDYD
jgi:organic radical activating enzyme